MGRGCFIIFGHHSGTVVQRSGREIWAPSLVAELNDRG